MQATVPDRSGSGVLFEDVKGGDDEGYFGIGFGISISMLACFNEGKVEG